MGRRRGRDADGPPLVGDVGILARHQIARSSISVPPRVTPLHDKSGHDPVPAEALVESALSEFGEMALIDRGVDTAKIDDEGARLGLHPKTA